MKPDQREPYAPASVRIVDQKCEVQDEMCEVSFRVWVEYTSEEVVNSVTAAVSGMDVILEFVETNEQPGGVLRDVYRGLQMVDCGASHEITASAEVQATFSTQADAVSVDCE